MRSVFSLSANAVGYLLAVLLVVCSIGCREQGHAIPSAPVTGVVTFNQKPLGFGMVIFVHKSGHTAGGTIAADGTFQLTAFQGENRIAVECFDVDRPGSTRSRSRVGGDKSLIPIKYTNYTTSGLLFDVKATDNTAKFLLKE